MSVPGLRSVSIYCCAMMVRPLAGAGETCAGRRTSRPSRAPPTVAGARFSQSPDHGPLDILRALVGVDGGIDAMRRSRYQPLRPEQLPDFVQPLKVVEQGSRVIYEPEALLKEPSLQDNDSEFAMRVRVTLRALWALKDMAHLMNPARYGLFAFQLISHKLLR